MGARPPGPRQWSWVLAFSALLGSCDELLSRHRRTDTLSPALPHKSASSAQPWLFLDHFPILGLGFFAFPSGRRGLAGRIVKLMDKFLLTLAFFCLPPAFCWPLVLSGWDH